MSDKVPRDPDDDYTAAMAQRRRDFVREHTGVELTHVGRYSFDPALLPGNVENFLGAAQVPIGLAGPLHIVGEHAQGEFYIPMATTEGTLVASYNRGMRLLNECGGVKTTVVEQYMQRSPAFMFDDALAAREFGQWVQQHLEQIRAAAEATTHVGHLVNIYQYAVGPLRHLRFNYTTGDAAGQNMTGKATLAACEWIAAHHPGGAKYLLSGNMDTDKKHSHLNMLVTRGKRVVAEAVIRKEPLKRIMGVDTAELFAMRQVSNTGAFLAGSSNNGSHAANGLTALFIATGQDVANVAESHAGVVYSQLLPRRRLLLVDHAAVADRRHLRRRHRPGHAARMPGDAGLQRRRQGRQVRGNLRRRGAGRRDLAVGRGDPRRLGVEPRPVRAQSQVAGGVGEHMSWQTVAIGTDRGSARPALWREAQGGWTDPPGHRGADPSLDPSSRCGRRPGSGPSSGSDSPRYWRAARTHCAASAVEGGRGQIGSPLPRRFVDGNRASGVRPDRVSKLDRPASISTSAALPSPPQRHQQRLLRPQRHSFALHVEQRA